MELNAFVNTDNETVQNYLIRREQQERLAISSTTSDILRNLNISIDNLPQKCQQILQQVATAQTSAQLGQFDPVTISLNQSIEMAEQLDDEYEILILKQKNKELQMNIDRNNKFLAQLRKDITLSRESLAKQTPNPDNIQEHCRQMRQKLASYEESCEKVKTKFSNLAVPEHAMPKYIETLATSHAQLCEQAASLRRSTEDIALAKQARDALHMLRK